MGSIRTLYASDTLIAVDKPAGIIVHGDGTGRATLTDRVRDLLISQHGAHAADGLQALQRLDRDTTGIVLFSLAKETQAAYDRMVAEHALRKRYLAVVEGSLGDAPFIIDLPIGRDRHDSRRMRVSPTGKPARTRVSPLETARVSGRALTLAGIEIETGRKHQIRVHLSHAGHPIAGDSLYGRGSRSGLMLHARELEFTDPVSGREVRILSPVPARFRRVFPDLPDQSGLPEPLRTRPIS